MRLLPPRQVRLEVTQREEPYGDALEGAVARGGDIVGDHQVVRAGMQGPERAHVRGIVKAVDSPNARPSANGNANRTLTCA